MAISRSGRSGAARAAAEDLRLQHASPVRRASPSTKPPHGSIADPRPLAVFCAATWGSTRWQCRLL